MCVRVCVCARVGGSGGGGGVENENVFLALLPLSCSLLGLLPKPLLPRDPALFECLLVSVLVLKALVVSVL